jgi:hypothetical protein
MENFQLEKGGQLLNFRNIANSQLIKPKPMSQTQMRIKSY